MSLTVVGYKSEGLKATVVLEGDNFSEVASAGAKQEAIKAATAKLGLCGLSGSSGPYPVDAQGNELQVEDMAALGKAAATLKYRNDFYVSQSLAL